MTSQAEPVGPADVVKVLQYNLNFLNNSLLEEDLSEHVDSERKELIKLLDNLVYRLNQESPENFSGRSTNKEGRSFSIMKIIAEKASTINKKILDHTTTSVEKNPDKVETEADKASSINLSKKIHDHTNEEKSLDKAESQEPAEQTTDVASVAEDIDDTEYELPPGSLSLERESSTTSSLRSTLTFDEFKRRLKANQGFTVSELKPAALFSGNLLKHKKKKIIGTGWYPRYCVLVHQFLFYFKSESDEREKGFIVLPWFKLSTKVKEKGFCFTLDPLEKGNAGYTFQSDTKEEYEKWKSHVEGTANKALTEDEEDLLNSLQEANIGNADEQNETDAKAEGIDNKALDAANAQSSASSVEEEVKKLQANQTAFSEDNIYMGLYDCRGEDDGDLSFKAGDILYILNKVDTSWWLAYGNGKCGLVPNNYLTEAFS